MVEEFSLLWRFRHWLAGIIGGVHVTHKEKMLEEAIEGWRKTNATLESEIMRWNELYGRFPGGPAVNYGPMNTKLIEALTMVEWQPVHDPDTNELLGQLCLWCHRKPHTPTCPRQVALGIA